MVAILGGFLLRTGPTASRTRPPSFARSSTPPHGCVAGGYANVIVEIANEVDVPLYTHAILQPERCHELIALVQRALGGPRRQSGGTAAGRHQLCAAARFRRGQCDRRSRMFLFLHGNHVDEPGRRSAQMVRKTAAPRPAIAASRSCSTRTTISSSSGPTTTSWPRSTRVPAGVLFDYRLAGRGLRDAAFRACPWTGASTPPRKRAFFNLRRRDDRERSALLKACVSWRDCAAPATRRPMKAAKIGPAQGTIVVTVNDGEDHEMDGALEDGCSPRSKGQGCNEKRQGQQDHALGIEPQDQRPACGERDEGDGRNGEPDRRQRRSQREIEARLQSVRRVRPSARQRFRAAARWRQ